MFEHGERNPRTVLLPRLRRVLVAALLCVATWLSAAAQQTPEDGEKVPLGADITLPCSCDGNKCTVWPLPDTVPQGFRYEERKKTSFLERGYMIEGQWQTTAGVGGTYVDEPWKGGRCKALAGNGAATENPVGPISITHPGTYRLRIITTEFSGVADCRYAQCATVTLTKSNTTTEDRYFTVEPEPEKGCNDKHNRISQVTDAEGNALDEGARLSMGLGAPLFMRGQTVRVPQGMRGVEVQFEDGSVVRYTGGTVVILAPALDDVVFAVRAAVVAPDEALTR